MVVVITHYIKCRIFISVQSAAVNDPNHVSSSSAAENKRGGIVSLATQPDLSSGVRSRRTTM